MSRNPCRGNEQGILSLENPAVTFLVLLFPCWRMEVTWQWGWLEMVVMPRSAFSIWVSLNSGSWSQVGGTVLESQEQLDVFSVALSNDGETLAVGGVPATKDGVVAKVFRLFAGD
jgi:hypothetical protein